MRKFYFMRKCIDDSLKSISIVNFKSLDLAECIKGLW